MLLNPYRFGGGGGGGGGGSPIEWLGAVGTPMTTAATSLAINLPGVVIGDLLVMHIANFWGANINLPGGWSAVTGDGAISGQRSRIFYKSADATTGATTVTVTASATCQMAAVVNRIKAGTFDPSAPPERAYFGGSNAAPNPPLLTPSWGNKRTLWIAAGANSNGYGVRTVTTWPYSDGQTSASSGASGSSTASVWSCYKIAEQASENPAAYVMSGSVDYGMGETIAIKPGA